MIESYRFKRFKEFVASAPKPLKLKKATHTFLAGIQHGLYPEEIEYILKNEVPFICTKKSGLLHKDVDCTHEIYIWAFKRRLERMASERITELLKKFLSEESNHAKKTHNK